MLGRKSLSSILAGFTKTVDDLEALMARNASQIASNNTQIDALVATNMELNSESRKAQTVADNIRTMLGETA